MHDHAHGPTNYNRVFVIGVGLNVAYIVIEASAGLYVNSLALLADAGHNLSDVLGLLLAWAAHALARVKPTARRTYGWRGSSILAAVLNGLMLLLVTGGIAWEAIRRFAEPAPVMGTMGEIVIVVAGVGVLLNSATALLFLSGYKHDLNIKAACLHMAADAGVSLVVVVSGVVINVYGWQWIDPLMSLLLAAVIFASTWGLLRESVDLALHAVPKGIEGIEVRQYLESLPGVALVHDLHIWAMSTTEVALTAHLVKPEIEDEDAFLADTSQELGSRFGIEHVTLQIERSIDSALCRHAHPDAL